MNTPTTLALLTLLLLGACGGGGGGSGAPTLPPAGDETPIPDPPPTPQPEPVVTQVMIELLDDDDLDEIATETGATIIGPVEGTPYYLVQIPDGVTLADFVAELEDDARIVDGEADIPASSPEGGGATLPAGGDLLPALIPSQPALLRLGLLQAQVRATGAGVRVAVLDTGVDATHESLAGHVEPGGFDFVANDNDPSEEADGIDNDGDGLIDEGFGHGTFVSSLILAIAPDATILPVRVLDSDSVGTFSTLARGITYAATAGVDVINLSAGAEVSSAVIKKAIQNAEDLGVLVITSAGNTGTQSVTAPGTLSDSFAVAAVDATDARAGFSAYGDDVDITAPGENLLGAYPGPGIGTARWSGTSFSAAIATGGFALVREAFPLLRARDVLRRMADTATDVDAQNPLFPDLLGKGRLDLDAATTP